MRNSIFLTLISLLILFSVNAQTANNQAKDYSEYPHWIEMMQDPSANFYETVEAFNQYWDGREITKGCGYKPFKRWENHWRNRLNTNGTRNVDDKVFNAYFDFKNAQSTRDDYYTGNWTNLGPIEKPGNSGTGQPNGNGRINAIAFHPTDADKIYIGAPAGGFWITEDGGNSWTSHTDDMPTLGVSSIVVDFVNTSIIYMGTGDRDAGDAVGMGVFKSTDGGINWEQWNNGMGNATVGRLIMHPTNHNIIFAATSNGLFKTTDAGQNWYQVKSGSFKEVVFKANNPNIIFASKGGEFYRSDNAGESFIEITSGIGTASRGVIGVSPADANVVYFHTVSGSEFNAIYRSTDAGLNFTEMSNSPNIMSWGCNGGSGGQGWYDLDLAVDPNNANIIYSGGVNVWKSINGGSSWSINSHWTGSCGVPAVHADCHVLEFSATNGNLYAGNDGGFYYTPNGGSNWIEKTSGLAISQIYKIGQARGNKDKVMNGYQDNGSATYLGEEEGFITVMGGDGMDCAYDHQNDSYAYGEYYNGAGISRIFNNINQGGISGGIGESGAWVTPLTLDVSDPETMYVGMQSIWRSNNIRSYNVQWKNIANLGGGNCNALEQSEANNNIFYVSKYSGAFYRSDNLNSANPSWIDLSDFLPASGNATDVETNPFDENTVYITIDSKVFKSVDKGLNWEDISLNIPNVNTNTIEYYKSDNEGLYVGTDAGIFYKNIEMTEWILFSEGFPVSTNATEIEIYYDSISPESDAVRTSTYGRGLWSSPTFYGIPVAEFESDEVAIPLGCEVNYFDKSSGVPHQWEWIFEGASIDTSYLQNPMGIQYLEEGTFAVTLTVTNPAGGDTITKTEYITVSAAMLPQVNFMAEDTIQCTSQSVQLTDLSQGCPLSWEWTFEPNTITYINETNQNSQNPEVLFEQAGVYSVSLAVTNSAGQSNLTKENYLFIGGESIPFIEGFNENSLLANGWTIENPDGKISWEQTTTTGINGESNVAWMNIFNYTYLETRDYLNSPLLSFIGYEQVLLSFDYAYAQRYNQTDSLIVSISADCGETWTRVYANGPDGDGSFETSEPTTQFFEPMASTDWSGRGYGAETPIINLSEWAGLSDIKLRFESFSVYGNNLYIDNIEVSNTAEIGEMKTNNQFVVYPNPATNMINVFVKQNTKGLNLQLTNLQGKIVLKTSLNQGNNQINIESLAKGIYFIKLDGTGINEMQKVIVQ